MTRFARAQGSKSSNKRVPEDSTPWNEMKEGIKKSQKEIKIEKEREKFNQTIRLKNYSNFMKESEDKVEKNWADIPTTEEKPNKTKKLHKLTENDVTDDMIQELCHSDPEVDGKLKKITEKIEKTLRKEGKINKLNMNKNREMKNKNSSDNASEETSTKIMHKNLLSIKKAKNKKKGPPSPKNGIPIINNDDSKIKEHKTNKNKQKESDNETIDGENSNNTPEEISAKVEPKNFVSNKKTKYKKKALQIPSPKINNKGDNTDKIKKSNKSTQKESNNEIGNGVNNNDEPEEESAKIPGQFVLIKKTKNKKKNSLKNKLINNEENVDGLNKTLPAQDSKKKNREKNKNIKKSISNEESGTDKGEKQKLNQGQKRKQRDENKEHKRRKPMQPAETIKMKGVEEQIVYYQNFPICKSDHDSLVALRKTLISKGVPKSEVDRTMKLERRKAEKRLSRAKKVVCFQCREVGHLLSECPMLENKSSSLIETSGTGICFKCGSTEHSARECKVSEGFKFAKCFICREQGHIASQCPDNPRGLYPKGGACKSCGSVEHFKKDCPKFLEKQDNDLFLKTISNGNLESIDDTAEVKNVVNKDKKKVVKF